MARDERIERSEACSHGEGEASEASRSPPGAEPVPEKGVRPCRKRARRARRAKRADAPGLRGGSDSHSGEGG